MTGTPSFVSPQQLLDLVADTLDPGYAAVAARRGTNPPRRWYDAPAVVLGCVLIGFLLVVAYVHAHRGAPQAALVRDRLVARVHDAEGATAQLTRQLDEEQARLTRLRGTVLPGELAQRLSAEQLAAGTVAVTGPGLTVTLDDPHGTVASAPPARGGTTPITATNTLTDRDIRSVVNQLWADGAEAIAVNDVRLTPTSAIRFAGQAVLIDFQHIRPPYVVHALGSADDLATAFASSAVASRYQTLKGLDHIGFDFAGSDRLSLPAAPPVTPRYARSGR
jgi:uncharacterized protein YlxW (UPF0749 family)